jgi:anti-sigma regulatory factor (Ser/Thr protein kinase)
LNEEDRNDLEVAVDEACTNVIRHSYDGARDRRILFQCAVVPGETIAFRLRDFGKKVPAEALQSRDLDDVRPGGLGLHFIREIMDEVEFNTKPIIGTELLLLKKVSPQESGEEQGS